MEMVYYCNLSMEGKGSASVFQGAFQGDPVLEEVKIWEIQTLLVKILYWPAVIGLSLSTVSWSAAYRRDSYSAFPKGRECRAVVAVCVMSALSEF